MLAYIYTLTMANQKMSEVLRNPGKILYNRFVMYIILVLAIADLLFLAVGGELMLVATFLIVGFVTSFFSKNMIVIMTIAMVIVNIIRFGTGQKLEGLENETSDLAQDEKKKKEEDEKKNKEEAEKKKKEEDEKKKEKEGDKDKDKEKEKEGDEEKDKKKKATEKFTSVSDADKIEFADSIQRIMNGIKELGQ
jgi:outer membrane biosynthesis protein TonB